MPGAALAQLFLLDVHHGELRAQLPAGVQVRGLLYGCPPVYAGPLPRLPGVTMVQVSCDWRRAGHVTPVLTSDWRSTTTTA